LVGKVVSGGDSRNSWHSVLINATRNIEREILMIIKLTTATGFSAIVLILAAGFALAAGEYGPGASDTEIKIGRNSLAR